MIHATGYQRAVPVVDALQKIQNRAPDEFDPAIVATLTQLVSSEPSCMLPMEIAGACVENTWKVGRNVELDQRSHPQFDDFIVESSQLVIVETFGD